MSEHTMIALTLEITAIALLLMVLAVIYVFRQAERAPKGFEDLDGFHLKRNLVLIMLLLL